jgi:hypothetical protein
MNTHQCTNVDGWCFHGCTFFVPPCPWANQGGEFKLTLFFPFLNLGWFYFQGFIFSSTPHVCPSLTYLLTFKLLPMHPGLILPPPIYVHAHLSIHLFTYPPINLCTYVPMHEISTKSMTMNVLQYTM